MQLEHERLDVYDLALEFLVLANGIIEGLPRGSSHLADQFTRASLSIVLNLAEARRQALEARQAPLLRDRQGVGDGVGSTLGPPGTGTGTFTGRSAI
ncbi:MAG TPA: four helix bundle protein [Polyangiaceae bacterium]